MPNQQNIIYTFSLTEYVLKFYGMCAKRNSSWFILILHSYSRGKMTSRVISKLIICSLGWKFFSFEEICCNVVLTVVLLNPSLVLGMKVFAFLCCTRERNMANHSFGCTCTCLLSFPLSYGDVSGLCFGGDSFFFPNGPRIWKHLHYTKKDISLFYLSSPLWWLRYFSLSKIKLKKSPCSSGSILDLTHIQGTDIRCHTEFLPCVEILLLVTPFEGIVSVSPIKWMSAQGGGSPSPKLGPGESWARKKYSVNVDWLNSRPIYILFSTLFLYLYFIHVYHRFSRVKHALHTLGGRKTERRQRRREEEERFYLCTLAPTLPCGYTRPSFILMWG